MRGRLGGRWELGGRRVSAGSERTGEPSAHLLRVGLNLGDVIELRHDRFHHSLAFFDVSHFPATEDDRHDHLILVLEKVSGLVNFEFDVVIACFGAEADFLDLGVVNVGLVVLLLLLVLELAEVHNSADRRLLIRRHFDEIQPGVAGDPHRFVRWDDAQLTAISSDYSDRADPNLLIDAMLLLDG